ncbi:MAG: CSLREA domain-containing protein [Betaproteobacteria bacterium]|nr:CSLREA domain-containing protein [Betaproteobacteria bacterium]
MLRRRISATLGSLLLSTLIAAAPAIAATITVTTLADELNADGDCSLREAVQAANTNAAVDACTAGAAGLDTVVLPAGVIPLSVTISVSDAVIVRGAGRASTTVNRGAANAFNGPGVAGATLTIEDLSVVGSVNTGGAQDIAVTRVDFSGVIGTMINSLNGSIAITDATLSGGGVNSSGGAMTVAGTTISGGGVNTSSGAISLTGTTIDGGGVNSSSGAVTLVDGSVTNAPGPESTPAPAR